MPATQGSKIPGVTKSGRRFVRESNRSLPGWRQLVMSEAQKHAPAQPFDGPVELGLVFWLPVPKSAPKRRRLHHVKKPDLSKLTRAVEDALKGVMFRDDSQIVRLEVEKRYAYETPVGVALQIRPVTQEEPSMYVWGAA